MKDKVGKGPGWSSVIDVGDLAPRIVESNCVGRIARSVYEAAERISLRLDDLAHDLDGVRRRWEPKRPHLFQGDDVAAKSEWPATRDPTTRKIPQRGFDPGCRASEFACRARAARHSGKCPYRKRAKEPRPSFSQRRASWRISADGARRACWLGWIRSSGSLKAGNCPRPFRARNINRIRLMVHIEGRYPQILRASGWIVRARLRSRASSPGEGS